MKKSKAETAATRRRIVEIASHAIRAKGIDGTGVAEVMAAAGLTHGAFYRHFESKEALVTEAAALSMDVFVEAAQTAAEAGQLQKHMERYLLPEYRDGVLGGCPVIQLGSDLARADTQTRHGVAQGLERLIELGTLENGDSPTAREDAIFALFALQGAVALSRLVEDRKLAKEILAIARRRVLPEPAAGKGRGGATSGQGGKDGKAARPAAARKTAAAAAGKRAGTVAIESAAETAAKPAGRVRRARPTA